MTPVPDSKADGISGLTTLRHLRMRSTEVVSGASPVDFQFGGGEELECPTPTKELCVHSPHQTGGPGRILIQLRWLTIFDLSRFRPRSTSTELNLDFLVLRFDGVKTSAVLNYKSSPGSRGNLSDTCERPNAKPKRHETEQTKSCNI